MEGSKSILKQTILKMLLMLLFVGIVAGVTYYIVYNMYKPTMLMAPTNVTVLEGNVLTWDVVEDADSYTIHLSSGNNDITINIFDTMYSINALSKVEYNISSQIEVGRDYTISVRANSANPEVQNSGYSLDYFYMQTE